MLWYTKAPLLETIQEEIARRLRLQAEGKGLPFCVIDARMITLIGMTRF